MDSDQLVCVLLSVFGGELQSNREAIGTRVTINISALAVCLNQFNKETVHKATRLHFI